MKKVLMTMLTVGLAFAMINTSGTAYAEEKFIGESEATITFKAPEKIDGTPLDPTNPDEKLPGDHDGQLGKPTSFGPLSLNYVSNFRFKEQEVSAKGQHYNSTSVNPFIQVTDLRGKGLGWNVKAELSNFIDENNNVSLKGAYMTLKNPGIATPSHNIFNKMPPTVKGEGEENIIKLESGVSTDVVNAKAKEPDAALDEAQGVGEWLISWLPDSQSTIEENNNVTLYIPGYVASTGEHKATINWTLSDGPSKNTSAGTTEVATDRY